MSQRLLTSLAAAALLLTQSGCGSSTNNDAGASFALTGFYTEAVSGNTANCTFPTSGITGVSIPLTGAGAEGGFAGDYFTPYLGFQNSLTGTAIQTERVYLNYSVPGSTVNIPSTSQPLSILLGPGTPRTTPIAGSSLPGSFNGCGKATAQVVLLPNAIRDYLIAHKAELPEPPYNLYVTVTAQGHSISGVTLDTNAVDFFIQIVTNVPIVTGSPTPTGAESDEATSDDDGSFVPDEFPTETPDDSTDGEL